MSVPTRLLRGRARTVAGELVAGYVLITPVAGDGEGNFTDLRFIKDATTGEHLITETWRVDFGPGLTGDLNQDGATNTADPGSWAIELPVTDSEETDPTTFG